MESVDFTVETLAALVGGQCFFNESAARRSAAERITGAAALADAEPGQITFFGNPKYLPQLKQSRATAVLVPLGFSESIEPIAVRVENPSAAFGKLLEIFAPQPLSFSPGIHPTASIAPSAVVAQDACLQAFVVIEPGAHVGSGTFIGAHGYVGHEAKIGAQCQFAPRVTVGARCLLGSRVVIHSGTVIGSDGFGFEMVNGKHVKIPQTGIVQVDDDVEIGANCAIDRARFGRTWIQRGTKIDNLVQIAHNVVIGENCLLVSQVGISGSTRLGNYVTLAGQVGLVGHIELGDQVVIAAQSGVTKNVPARQVMFGSPALPMRESKEQLAYVSRLKKLNARVKQLEQLLDEKAKSSPTVDSSLVEQRPSQ